MQNYIVNNKDKKEDNIDQITHIFKEVLIDTPQNLFLNIDTINKLVFTQLGFFQNIKLANIVNNLANNASKYQITSANIIVPFINPIPYIFTTSTNI